MNLFHELGVLFSLLFLAVLTMWVQSVLAMRHGLDQGLHVVGNARGAWLGHRLRPRAGEALLALIDEITATRAQLQSLVNRIGLATTALPAVGLIATVVGSLAAIERAATSVGTGLSPVELLGVLIRGGLGVALGGTIVAQVLQLVLGLVYAQLWDPRLQDVFARLDQSETDLRTALESARFHASAAPDLEATTVKAEALRPAGVGA